MTDTIKKLGDLLEPRGEWTPELQGELESIGDDGISFAEACIKLLEGKE